MVAGISWLDVLIGSSEKEVFMRAPSNEKSSPEMAHSSRSHSLVSEGDLEEFRLTLQLDHY
jgi:hypothetical protein